MNVPQVTIEVASRAEAADILNCPERCAEVTCLISIGADNDQLPAGYNNVVNRLRLLVNDVVTEEGATESDVLQIIQVAESLRTARGKVLVHCEAGVSRSPAAALIIYACWLGPGQEQEAMGRVLAQRPMAVPNPRVVELGDKLLGREGRLLAVLSRAA